MGPRYIPLAPSNHTTTQQPTTLIPQVTTPHRHLHPPHQITCLDDACPHRGAPLSDGWLKTLPPAESSSAESSPAAGGSTGSGKKGCSGEWGWMGVCGGVGFGVGCWDWGSVVPRREAGWLLCRLLGLCCMTGLRSSHNTSPQTHPNPSLQARAKAAARPVWCAHTTVRARCGGGVGLGLGVGGMRGVSALLQGLVWCVKVAPR